jgi:hypothetical protein
MDQPSARFPAFGRSLCDGDRVLLFVGSNYGPHEPLVCLGGATIVQDGQTGYDIESEKWTWHYKSRTVRADRDVYAHRCMPQGDERIDFIKWPACCVRKMTPEEMEQYPPNPRPSRGKMFQHQFAIGDVVRLYSCRDESDEEAIPEKFYDRFVWGGMRGSNQLYVADEPKAKPHDVVGYAIVIGAVNEWWTTKFIGTEEPTADEDGEVKQFKNDLFSGIEQWKIGNMEVVVDRKTRLPMFVKS